MTYLSAAHMLKTRQRIAGVDGSLVMPDPLIAFRAVHEDGELMTTSKPGRFLISSQLPSMINKGEKPGAIHVVNPALRLKLSQAHPQPVNIWEVTDRSWISFSFSTFLGDHKFIWPSSRCFNGSQDECQVTDGRIWEKAEFKRRPVVKSKSFVFREPLENLSYLVRQNGVNFFRG